MSAATICPARGCIEVQPCALHPRAPFASASRSSDLYKSAQWKRDRAAFLKANPRCVWRLTSPRLHAPPTSGQYTGELCGEPSRVVDHYPPHRGDSFAFWDRSTWRALCRRHSNVSTGKESHEEGRRRR